MEDNVTKKKIKFTENVARLEALSPLKILSRGYAAVEKNGKTVNSVQGLTKGEEITLKLSDGSLDCNIVKVNEEYKND